MMKLGSSVLALACILAIGCGEPDETDTDTDANIPVVPQEGGWISSDFTYTQNDCAFASIQGDVGLTLELNGAFGIIVDHGDATRSYCLLDGSAFDCEPISQVIPMDDLDAVLALEQTLSGEFLAENTATATMRVDLSCTGKECDAVAAESNITMPCASVASGTFTAQE